MAIDGWELGSAPGGAATGSVACSDWAQSQRLDPVGNAGYYEGFLLVDQPLPWPFDVSTVPDLVEVAELAASAGLRLQTVMRVPPLAQGQQERPEPDGARERRRAGIEASPLDVDVDADVDVDVDDPPRRLICYRTARPGWAGPLVRSERLAKPSSFVEEASALVNPNTPPADTADLVIGCHRRPGVYPRAPGRVLWGAGYGAIERARSVSPPLGYPYAFGARATLAATALPRRPLCSRPGRCGRGRIPCSSRTWFRLRVTWARCSAVTGAVRQSVHPLNKLWSGPYWRRWVGSCSVRCAGPSTSVMAW